MRASGHRRPRTRAAFAAITLSVLVHACDNSGEGLTWTFTVEQNVPEQTIPGDSATAGDPLNISQTFLMPDVTQEPEYQKEIFDVVNVVASADVTLSILASSPHQEFSFIDSVSVSVGPVGGGPGTQEIALLANPSGTSIQLETTTVDLSDLISMGAYELRIDVQGVIPGSDVIFDGVVSFDISVVRN